MSLCIRPRYPVQNLRARRGVTRLVLSACFAVATGLGAVASSAGAQTDRPFASPMLEPGHWAIDAARRAALVGLAPRDFGWGDGTLTLAAAGRVLYEANKQASATAAPLRETIAAEWRRFAQEFPAVAARLEGDAAVTPPSQRPRLAAATASVAAGAVSSDGRLLPVRSLDRTRENTSPPEPLPRLEDAELEVRLGLLGGRRFAGEVAAGRSDGDWQLRDWHAMAVAKSLGVWLGKALPDYGPGAGGGLIFDGRAAFTGGGLLFVNPVRAPWVLSHLGPLRAEAFLSRIDSSAASRHPWVFGARVSISPHPRLLLGASEAFMFAGEGQPKFTFRNFKEMFLTHGIKVAGREFENGIASLEARWRPPIPRVPVVTYVEWGTDDNHSAWFKFPALVTGIALPSVPFVPALSLGLERTSFARPCSTCNGCDCDYYATWYRHYVFMDGWTLDRQLIGHPLGGDGTEWLVHGTFDDAARKLRVDGRGYVRRRGPYNLFAPTREGRSVGGRAALVYRVTPAIELRVHGELERGRRDWTASSVGAGVRWVP